MVIWSVTLERRFCAPSPPPPSFQPSLCTLDWSVPARIPSDGLAPQQGHTTLPNPCQGRPQDSRSRGRRPRNAGSCAGRRRTTHTHGSSQASAEAPACTSPAQKPYIHTSLLRVRAGARAAPLALPRVSALTAALRHFPSPAATLLLLPLALRTSATALSARVHTAHSTC